MVHCNSTMLPTEMCSSSDLIGHALSNQFVALITTYFVFLIVCSKILNLTLIYVIIRNPLLHYSTNILFVNLALTDLLTSSGVLPFDVDYLIHGYFRFSKYVCGVKETVFLLSLPASIVNLLLLTFDRFLLIMSPRKHRRFFQVHKIICTIWLSWAYVICVSIYPIIYQKDAVIANKGFCAIDFPRHYFAYELVVNFAIPLVMIIIMNTIIFLISTRHSRIEQITMGTRERDSHVVALTVPSNFMSAKIIMVIVGCCACCWLSFITLAVSNYICGSCHARWVTWLGNAVNFSTVVLNPVLYGLLNSQIRTVIVEMFRRCRMKTHHGDDGEVLALHESMELS